MSKNFEETSCLYGGNSVFIEELFQKYLSNPSSIDQSWVKFFENDPTFEPIKTTAEVIVDEIPKQKFENFVGIPRTSTEKSLRAKFMIMSYRDKGHYLAKLDPLNLEKMASKEKLKLNIEDFGFSASDLKGVIDVSGEFSSLENCSLGELLNILERTYCSSVGAEFSHIEDQEQQSWLYAQLESKNIRQDISGEHKKSILKNLVEVEGFEQYLHVKFPGAKRFSIEGGDSALLCLDYVIELTAMQNADNVVLGLAHRGRLSTLTKVMGKPYRAVISEFMGNSAFPTDLDIAGDVKYHMGYSSDRVAKNGNSVHLSLTPNPSHLEAVNPVVAGKVRAKQDLQGRDRSKAVGVLVHGDAAFCGQGIVSETLSMSGLEAYNVGGIFHLVINNQIGFTANSHDSRPGRYCTEVAKMVGAPILHVNGDDIEAVLMATEIAFEFRRKFGKDVVVDIVCYRKYGHNEGDEPMYTQSIMYNVIKDKATPAAVYAEKLISQNVIGKDYYQELKDQFKNLLDSEYEEAKNFKPRAQWLEGNWSGFERNNNSITTTGVEKAKLVEIGVKLCDLPANFEINKKLTKLFEQRKLSLTQDSPIDWATGEQLAFATLLNENVPIRITGQDAERGTFSHRHAVLHSQTSHNTYTPLNNLSPTQSYFEVADSNLSEYGVLGFEYGYSLVNPKNLVIWEGQFGDFANGAQIIFDQFISSAETKWLRMSGLVVLLPHGYEGQGPEHSSARLERFLQLCAENNMQVAYPTTPASIFHLLRRQVMRTFRKPLIIMSPKSLLRHKLAVSKLEELASGTSFKPVIDETNTSIEATSVERIIFCTGKIYYDLYEARELSGLKNSAIIRIEELYPFPKEQVMQIFSKYTKAKTILWCQEEPLNMGAWHHVTPYFNEAFKTLNIAHVISYVGRAASASPAVGYLYVHNKQQESLVMQALGMENKNQS